MYLHLFKSPHSDNPRDSAAFSNQDFVNYSESQRSLEKYHQLEKITRKNRVMKRAQQSRKKARVKYQAYIQKKESSSSIDE